MLYSLLNLNNVVIRLEEALSVKIDEHNLVLDATIQRFEFVFELTWKTMKKLLEALGKEATFPKLVIQEAYAAGWITDERLWLQMMQDRNLTSHTYKHELALEIYQKIKIYYVELKKLSEKLKQISSTI